MFKNKNGIIEIDLLKMIGLLMSKLWLIILVAFIGGASAYAYSTYMIDEKFESSVLVYVNNSNISVGGTNVSITSGDISASQSLVDTYIVILKTRNTLETVIKKGDLDLTYQQLSGMISASAVNSTEVFKITARCNDPKLAYEIVNTIADVFPDKVASIVSGTSAKIVDYGVINTNKVAPTRTKYAMVGILAGGFAVCAILILIEFLDKRIHDEEFLHDNFEFPILGSIPSLLTNSKDIKKYKKSYKKYDRYRYSYGGKEDNEQPKEYRDAVVIGDGLHFEAREAYKLLRTNIQFALSGDAEEIKCEVLGVTSSIRGEGKSTTACNLAYTIAQNDKRVLLIDGDMRLPSISTKLNIKNKYGLSDYILGTATINDIIYRYNDKLPNFHVLLSGTIPPNPSELLGSKAMLKFINGVKANYDYIVIDLPPVNIVTDALVTKDYIDGIVVTVREDYSLRDELYECVNSIEYLKTKLLGFVLTDVKEDGAFYNSNYRYRKYKYSYKKYRKYNKYYDNYYKSYQDVKAEEKKENK